MVFSSVPIYVHYLHVHGLYKVLQNENLYQEVYGVTEFME